MFYVPIGQNVGHKLFKITANVKIFKIPEVNGLKLCASI